MHQNEIDTELGQVGARELLATAPISRLAYNGSDGFPRVIPIGFHWSGHALVMCTAVTAPKVRALTVRPQAAVTIDVGNTPADARSLLIRGVASVEIVDGVPDEYLAASSKVLSAAEAAEFAVQVRQMYDRMARISIVPTWARYFDFGAGRFPRFLRELSEGGRG